MKRKTAPKVLAFFNIIAPYNVPFFNRLAATLDHDILFLFDQMKESNRNWKLATTKMKFDYRIESSFSLRRSAAGINGAVLERTFYVPFFVFKRIWKYKPVFVLSIEFGLRTLFCLLACKFTNTKVYVVSDVTSLTEANTGSFRKHFRKFIAKRINGAIARSYAAAHYLESLGIDKEKIVVAPYAIEPKTPQENNQSEAPWTLPDDIQKRIRNKFCFLYSGHLTHAKGIDLLVHAVSELPKSIQQQIVVLMAGGTSDDLAKLSVNYNKEIFFPLGFIPNEHILDVYAYADCFVLPTRSDTWGLVVNEAVVMGCPVMVSKYAGCAGELIIHEKSGVVFDPLSREDFVEKFLFCVRNNEQLQVFAANAKQKLTEYNNNVSAARVATLINYSNPITPFDFEREITQ